MTENQDTYDGSSAPIKSKSRRNDTKCAKETEEHQKRVQEMLDAEGAYDELKANGIVGWPKSKAFMRRNFARSREDYASRRAARCRKRSLEKNRSYRTGVALDRVLKHMRGGIFEKLDRLYDDLKRTLSTVQQASTNVSNKTNQVDVATYNVASQKISELAIGALATSNAMSAQIIGPTGEMLAQVQKGIANGSLKGSELLTVVRAEISKGAEAMRIAALEAAKKGSDALAPLAETVAKEILPSLKTTLDATTAAANAFEDKGILRFSWHKSKRDSGEPEPESDSDAGGWTSRITNWWSGSKTGGRKSFKALAKSGTRATRTRNRQRTRRVIRKVPTKKGHRLVRVKGV